MLLIDRISLRRKYIIETINNQLRNFSQNEIQNTKVSQIADQYTEKISAYCFQEKTFIRYQKNLIHQIAC
jgi:hypothetical protein